MTEPARRYALVAGVNHYQNDRVPVLSYAQRDAGAMADLLTSLGFSVRTLLGRQATQAALEAELVALSSLPRDEVDLLVLFFSGHGEADEAGKAYLLAWDFDPDAGAGRLDLDNVREHYIEGAQARQVYGIFDSCHAGEAASDVSALRHPSQIDGALLAQQTAATFAALRGGRAVLAAVAGDQAAKEISTLNHSLLTYYILKGWAEGEARDSEGMLDTELLYSYVTREIGQNYANMPSPVQGGYLEGAIVLPTPFPAGQGGAAHTLALLDADTLTGVARRLRHLPNEERTLTALAAELTLALEKDEADGRLAALVRAVIAPEGADLLGLQWALAAKLLRPAVEMWPDGDAPGLVELITQVYTEVQGRWAAGGPLAPRWAEAVVGLITSLTGPTLLARLTDAQTPPAERERLLDLCAALGTGGGQALVTATLVILSGGPFALFPTAARVFCTLRPAGGERAVTMLAAHLASADPAERQAAAHALAVLDTTEVGPALDALQPLLTATDVAQRVDAVAALGLVAGRGGSDQAAPLLITALADGESGVRAAACHALSRLIWASGPASLEATIPNPDQPGSPTPLKASGTARQEVIVGLLTAQLGDGDAGVRQAAIEALARLGTTAVHAAHAPLLARLADSASPVRVAAIQALGSLAAPLPAVVSALTALLGEADGGVRGHAAVALARLGAGDVARAGLTEALGSADPLLAGAAGAALVTDPAGQAAALPVLIGLLAHADPAVAGQATEALAHPTLVGLLLNEYDKGHNPHLLAPLALLTRTRNIRLLAGGHIVRADGTTVPVAEYQG